MLPTRAYDDCMLIYLFRLASLSSVLTLLGCHSSSQVEDAKQKEAMKRTFEAQHGGADDAIRKYTNSQTAKPPKKETRP